MTKELARYFVKLIAENLQFSFNGMGIPSGICEWLESQLIQGNYDKVKDFIQKRYDELEKPKKKRKFRAMTINEHCSKGCSTCEYSYKIFCDYQNVTGTYRHKEGDTPYKTRAGKYILVEVTNDA